MRVAIYQRWLATLGGGERYTIELARALRDLGHSVDLITHAPVTAEAIVARLGLEVGGVGLRTLAEDPDLANVGAASAEYELFINCSHGDLPPTQAAYSIAVAFFPLPLASYATGYSAPLPRRAASAIATIQGLHAPESADGASWAWTGATVDCKLVRPWPVPATRLHLACAPLLPTGLEPPRVRVAVDGVPLAERQDRWRDWSIPLPRPVRAAHVMLAIEPWTLRGLGQAPDDRERGLPLSQIALAGPGDLLAPRPAPLSALRPHQDPAVGADRLARYQHIWSISAFTATWVERRWERPSDLVYPPVAQPAAPGAKQRQILAVGRFFTGAHTKRHDALIAAFASLAAPGWELHLVGGCDTASPAQAAYLAELQRQAANLPVFFHVNADQAALAARYAQASLFWHAAGLDADAEGAPEQLEHFGIVTVEALAAGCVPLVFAGGGQPEIIAAGQVGAAWTTPDELVAATRDLIADPARLAAAQAQAPAAAERFGRAAFRARVAALIAEIA